MTIAFVGSHVGTHAATSAQTVAFSNLLDEGGGAPTLQEGDYVVVAVEHGTTVNRTQAQLTPAGYTALHADDYRNDSNDSNFQVSGKFMGATPDADVAIPASNATTACVAYAIFVFRGVDPTTPMDVTPVVTGGTNSGKANAPAITPVTPGAWIAAFGGAAVAAGAAFTNAGDLSTTTNHFRSAFATTTTNDANVCGGIKTDWASGTFDPAVFGGSTTTNTGSWSAVTLALRPLLGSVAGDGAGALAIAGDGSGGAAVAGAGAGDLAVDGQGAGTVQYPAIGGGGSGALDIEASADGTVPVAGDASADLAPDGSGDGTAPIVAEGSSDLEVTGIGQASGSLPTITGDGTGPIDLAGSGAASAPVAGESGGDIAPEGSGEAAGLVAGAGEGEVPLGGTGDGSGILPAIGGDGAGEIDLSGAGAGAAAVAGQGGGDIAPAGSGGGSVAIAGDAAGPVDVTGAGSGSAGQPMPSRVRPVRGRTMVYPVAARANTVRSVRARRLIVAVRA